jgi:hypothetical protein
MNDPSYGGAWAERRERNTQASKRALPALLHILLAESTRYHPGSAQAGCVRATPTHTLAASRQARNFTQRPRNASARALRLRAPRVRATAETVAVAGTACAANGTGRFA